MFEYCHWILLLTNSQKDCFQSWARVNFLTSRQTTARQRGFWYTLKCEQNLPLWVIISFIANATGENFLAAKKCQMAACCGCPTAQLWLFSFLLIIFCAAGARCLASCPFFKLVQLLKFFVIHFFVLYLKVFVERNPKSKFFLLHLNCLLWYFALVLQAWRTINLLRLAYSSLTLMIIIARGPALPPSPPRHWQVGWPTKG